ncbi:MAG: hypothetical protein ABI655_12620, partial [Phenylobacterium sp.]
MPFATDYTALLLGESWNGLNVSGRPAFVTYSFETGPATYMTDVKPADFLASFEALTAADQVLAHAALDQWGAASGLTFLEVPAGQGDIRFGKYDFSLDPDSASSIGFAYYPEVRFTQQYGLDFPVGGDVFIRAGEGDLHLYLHEIGHALGLHHPHEGNPPLDPSLDDESQTVMSYHGPISSLLGPLDIAAIQHLYGPPTADGTQVASWSWNAATYVLTQGGGPDGDTISGVSTADVVSGGDGADLVFTREGDDTIDGGAGSDTLWAGAGANIVSGGDGDDVIGGFETAADTLSGGNGDDALWSQRGVVHADGGAGMDSLVLYTLSTVGFSYDIAELTTNGSSITGVEHIQLFGGTGADTLTGGAGDDAVLGGAGNDLVLGLDGNDLLRGDEGADTLQGGGGNDLLEGNDGDDLLQGEGGDNLLYGQDGADTLVGGAGNDALYAGGGDDLLRPGLHNAIVDGGEGNDIVDFSGALAAVNVTVNVSGFMNGGIKTVSNLEGVMGSAFADTLAGASGATSLTGAAGNDLISDPGGSNHLWGDAGNDTVTGGADFDEINGN